MEPDLSFDDEILLLLSILSSPLGVEVMGVADEEGVDFAEGTVLLADVGVWATV